MATFSSQFQGRVYLLNMYCMCVYEIMYIPKSIMKIYTYISVRVRNDERMYMIQNFKFFYLF